MYTEERETRRGAAQATNHEADALRRTRARSYDAEHSGRRARYLRIRVVMPVVSLTARQGGWKALEGGRRRRTVAESVRVFLASEPQPRRAPTDFEHRRRNDPATEIYEGPSQRNISLTNGAARRGRRDGVYRARKLSIEFGSSAALRQAMGTTGRGGTDSTTGVWSLERFNGCDGDYCDGAVSKMTGTNLSPPSTGRPGRLLSVVGLGGILDWRL